MEDPEHPVRLAWATVQLGFLLSMLGGGLSLTLVASDFGERAGWRVAGCVAALVVVGALVFNT